MGPPLSEQIDVAGLAFLASLGFAVKRIGLEAGPLSQWLHAWLKRAGFGLHGGDGATLDIIARGLIPRSN
jgi:hypothetical protein